MAGRRTYRTSQGKNVDLGAILLQNENTRAVGNMGVNARGDRIDSANRVIDTKVKQTQRQYNKQVGPVDEIPAASRRAVADDISASRPVESSAKEQKSTARKQKETAKQKKQSKKQAEKVVVTPTQEVQLAKDVDINDLDSIESTLQTEEKPAPVSATGLADAIARARTIKQEQAKTPRQLAQEKAGVKKI